MTEKAARRTFESLEVGESAQISRRIEAKDVDAFASLSGDYNPLHVSDEYGSRTPFGKRVVHGMFLGALVSQLVGMQLPGESALLVKETLQFVKPVHIGDTVDVSARVASKSVATCILEIEIVISVLGDTVATGVVHVLVRE